MRFIDEYRDGELGQRLLRSLRASVEGRPALRFMEVCGTHTVSIFRSGLRPALPPEISLLSGPGCPVCVTPQRDIDKAIELAGRPEVVLVTFGDMLRVPGTRTSLETERARGAEVRIVYSPGDALGIAERQKSKKVVFFGVGFETTAPAVALVVREAQRRGLDNFFLLSVHKLIPPALRALLDGPCCRDVARNVPTARTAIDGFILPGHVSAIIGADAYSFLGNDYRRPGVVTGFEPLDVLQGISMLVHMLADGRKGVAVQYRRAVTNEGNLVAQRVLAEVFEPVNATWRGLGEIPLSGLALRQEYADVDAERVFDIHVGYSSEPAGCSCGEMLRGVKQPYECGLFATACTPDHPIGPCMVSSEGTCAAYYQYGER
ncbi:MAG: hydrogenase formation protein HypD [Chloroflexi bacterium]|nr:hydrogenase formation protein HypD [Chloroflexota bacterium]